MHPERPRRRELGNAASHPHHATGTSARSNGRGQGTQEILRVDFDIRTALQATDHDGKPTPTQSALAPRQISDKQTRKSRRDAPKQSLAK